MQPKGLLVPQLSICPQGNLQCKPVGLMNCPMAHWAGCWGAMGAPNACATHGDVLVQNLLLALPERWLGSVSRRRTDLPPHRRPSCVSQPGLVNEAPAPAASISFFMPPATDASKSMSCSHQSTVSRAARSTSPSVSAFSQAGLALWSRGGKAHRCAATLLVPE